MRAEQAHGAASNVGEKSMQEVHRNEAAHTERNEQDPRGGAAHTRVGRVRLQVADLARSIGFYENVLGLRVLTRAGDTAALGVEGSSEALVEFRERAGVRPVPRGGRLGLFHFAVLLPDRAALGRFLRHVTAQDVRVGLADHAVSEAVYLHDPDNLGIEVYADRPRSAWQRRDGELVMTTEPLDVDGVVQAAGSHPWRGAPEGTTIGHVHLSVSNLQRAEAFYHDALGLERTVWSYPGALFFAADGYHHHVGTNVWAARAPLPQPDDAQLLEWELIVPHRAALDAIAARLEDGGFPVYRDGADGLVTRDPWGTALRLRVAGGAHDASDAQRAAA